MKTTVEKPKKAKLQELADYLGVTLSAVKQYNPTKKELMLLGLAVKQQMNKKQ